MFGLLGTALTLVALVNADKKCRFAPSFELKNLLAQPGLNSEFIGKIFG
jgi:hypothetical protein